MVRDPKRFLTHTPVSATFVKEDSCDSLEPIRSFETHKQKESTDSNFIMNIELPGSSLYLTNPANNTKASSSYFSTSNLTPTTIHQRSTKQTQKHMFNTASTPKTLKQQSSPGAKKAGLAKRIK